MSDSPLISLILCSRNDSYMGNSRWRLETSINLALLYAKEANFLNKLEIIVSDWGSKEPLSDVLNLIPEAEDRVKFVHIPSELASKKQKDSKFPEVIALNAAARRASGQYIGRIDNDTIVGAKFFENFSRLLGDENSLWFDPADSFMFIERRSIPYRFSSKSYPLEYVYNYIKSYGSKLKIETARTWGFPFWWSPVGIMLFNREIWHNSRGYDEKFIYWGWMEGDMALRLRHKHILIDFKDSVGNYLYHLEHYPSMTEYKDRNGPATPRKKNVPKIYGLNYQVNDEDWGVNQNNINLTKYLSKQQDSISKTKGMGANLSHIKMRYCFFMCNTMRAIDIIRLEFPNFIQSKIDFIKIKIGKMIKIIKS